MRTIVIAILFLFALLPLAGCRKHDEAACANVRERLREVCYNLNLGEPGIHPFREIGSRMDEWFSSVSNVSLRAGLSLELSEMLLTVNLTNQPYRAVRQNATRSFPRLDVAASYPRYINVACWIMKKNGCPPELEMDFFFKALQKFRDACFSVPLAFDLLPGEDLELYSARTTTAWHLYSDYDYVISYIRRFVLPELSKYLPPELHDEFKRRIEPFFDYPSKEEFYEMMHPRPKSPAVNPAPRKDPDIDVDVELPEDKAKESKR